MITPRRTRLVRVPDLHEFRRAIATLESAISNLQSAIIVVPTGGAARQLRRTLAHDRGAIVTREELYDCFHQRLASPPRRLTALERDVIAQAAARAAAARGAELSFQLRPGLVAEMLRFYDQLRRQSQQVSRFEELIDQALGGDELDRGAARMRTQTRFLADAFREYERRVSESGGCDEHVLRERLMFEAAADPIRHVVVSVPDWIADPAGLFSADFDLLTRVPGLESLDIVCTEAVLRAGFHERLHNWWPGLEEVSDAARQESKPVLITPSGAPADEPWWTVRDREEELVAIARQIKADERSGDAVPPNRTAVVFKGPLPYLYLAAEVFGAAGIPYEAFDALPFAAEPTVAALDLVLDAVSANFTRSTLVALLRSPHFIFSPDGVPITREATSALDRTLSAARYLGDPERLDGLTRAPHCRRRATPPASCCRWRQHVRHPSKSACCDSSGPRTCGRATTTIAWRRGRLVPEPPSPTCSRQWKPCMPRTTTLTGRSAKSRRRCADGSRSKPSCRPAAAATSVLFGNLRPWRHDSSAGDGGCGGDGG